MCSNIEVFKKGGSHTVLNRLAVWFLLGVSYISTVKVTLHGYIIQMGSIDCSFDLIGTIYQCNTKICHNIYINMAHRNCRLGIYMSHIFSCINRAAYHPATLIYNNWFGMEVTLWKCCLRTRNCWVMYLTHEVKDIVGLHLPKMTITSRKIAFNNIH